MGRFTMTEEAYIAFVLQEIKYYLHGLYTHEEFVNKIIAGTPEDWITKELKKDA